MNFKLFKIKEQFFYYLVHYTNESFVSFKTLTTICVKIIEGDKYNR